ncbi:acetyl-CoA carboxylase biotin carboxylase subunit, partial [Candidatus Poribacteria bacterium]|nr:acetyl-CoA carboxylase biotin carboxylase subunit [Candidatus Poribacteria bacterium]
RQGDIKFSGHAMECRINAEDPDKNFMPFPGTISMFHVPGGPGIRLDSHLYVGYKVPPIYDSLVAKLIAHASSRDETIARMKRALDEFVIGGIKTTIPFHKKMMEEEKFIKSDIHVGFLNSFQMQQPS